MDNQLIRYYWYHVIEIFLYWYLYYGIAIEMFTNIQLTVAMI